MMRDALEIMVRCVELVGGTELDHSCSPAACMPGSPYISAGLRLPDGVNGDDCLLWEQCT